MTAPAHPLVFRPVIDVLRKQGHDVHVTARDYAQTLGLLERLGMEHDVVGEHGGASRFRKLKALVTRTAALRRLTRRRPGKVDLAVAHGSNDLPLVARSLGIPAVNMFDYEFAIQQHNIGCRLARRVLVPDLIPPERLRRFGVGPEKLVQYPGLKEEYYLADFQPDPAVLEELGVDRERIVVILRPPPEVSMYHRTTHGAFGRLTERLGRREDVHAVVVPRTVAQRESFKALGQANLIVCEKAVDAQSLIAYADLVVSAGGTMNREAVALGTPVYTTFEGTMGGVDEALIREGRLHQLTDADAVEFKKADADRQIRRRDPAELAEMIVATRPGPAASRPARSR